MKYELALVVNAKIEDNIRTATVDKVKDIITAAGGEITNVDEVGKKQLAYEIQKMNIGDYYFIQFDAESEAPAQIEAKLRIQDNILRFLCVKQDA